MSTCEIEDCGRETVGTVNGIEVCERCRVHFESVGWGTVYFGGRWHGVKGCTYTPTNCKLFPGLKNNPLEGDRRGLNFLALEA